MKHAYLIIAHNEYPVLKTLLELLDDRRNAIFLHIDSRAQDLYENIQTIHLQRADLKILSNRVPVHWGDISQVEVEYLLLETAIQQGEYAYYHLLSGVDLPLHSQTFIHQFFSRHAGKEFVSFWHSPQHRKDLDRKVSRYYFFTRHRRPGEKWHALTTPLFNLLLLLQKAFGIRRKKEVDFQKGPNWFSITHTCGLYLLSQKDWVLKRMKHTLCADEIFVQTVLWNSPFKKNIFNPKTDNEGNQRLIDWERGNPYVWQDSDQDELAQSPLLFARKFSSQQNGIIQFVREHVEKEEAS